MLATVLQENFKRGLGIVSHAIPGTSPLPSLSTVALTAKGGYFELWGTDISMGIRFGVGAVIEAEGGICAPAKLLADYIGALPEATVKLETDDKRAALHLNGGRFSATINGLAPKEYPFFHVVTDAERPAFELEPDWFRQIAEGVAIAAAKDESRVTGAVCFRVASGRATVIAADGFRMGRLQFNTSAPDVELLIPRSTVETLGRLLKDADENVLIYMRSDSISFVCGAIEVYSRTLAGKFFDVEQVIPAAVEVAAELDTAETIRALKLMEHYAKTNHNILNLHLDGSGLELAAAAAEVGFNKTVIPVEAVTGVGDSAVNVKLLLAALGALGTERFKIGWSATRVMLIRPIGRAHYLHVIMPMNPARPGPVD